MKKTCFVIMPIGDANLDRAKFELFKEIYEDIIKPAVRRSLTDCDCIRADEIKEVGSIVRDIVSQLCDADLVIADLTDKNPNVFYELGVRHVLGKPTILISQKMEDVPFDLRPYRTIIYGISPRATKNFQNELEQTILHLFENSTKHSSPVSDYIDPSRIKLILNSFGKTSDLQPAEVTIKNIESKLEQLRQGQDRLSNEVIKLNLERQRVVTDINEIEELRASSAEKPQFDKKLTDASKLSGLWLGSSGKLQVYVSGKTLKGDYDWNGYDMAGHIQGEFDDKILKFEWTWDKSPEKGNGFFICDESYQFLKGGWFFDFQEVDLDEAVKGNNDKLIHPWSYTRQAKSA